MVKIVEWTLEFNELIQSRQGLKIVTPNQMLNRLPISLAQLNAGNYSEKLNNEVRWLLYPLQGSRKLTKKSLRVWSTLFKNGNNLLEQ